MVRKLLQKYKGLNRSVKASLWILICTFLQRGISFITTPIFTRILTTAEYGAYSSFSSWQDILSVFITLNLSAGVYMQGLVKFDEEKNVFTSSLQGLTLILTFIWSILYFLFRNWWNDLLGLTTVQCLAMLVMIWSTAVFNFWVVEQRVKLNYVALVIITLIASVAKPGLGIILVLNAEDKVLARILGLALVELVCYVGLFFVQMRRGKVFYSKKFWKYALSFNIPLIPHYLSQTVLNSADRIMINSMVGSGEAGIYNLAYSVSRIMGLFNTALLSTLSPWVYQKIKARKFEDISKTIYPCLIGIAFINIALIAFAPEVISMFAPKAYADAIWIIPPIAMSVYFTFAYNVFAAFEFYNKKMWKIALASVVGALLNILLNYLVIPIWGYFAAGYTTLICYIVYCGMHYVFMRDVCKKDLGGAKVYDFKVLMTISTVFLICGFSFLFIYKLPILRYLIIALLGILAIVRRKKVLSLLKELKNR